MSDTSMRDEAVAERTVNPAAHALEGASADEPLRAARVERLEHSESSITRLLEQQAARIPSHWFLVGALGSMGLSLALELKRQHRWSHFVGMWSHALLSVGVYNKLVKTLGQD